MPDVEAALIAYLKANGVKASTAIPLPRRPGMTRLRRVGGPTVLKGVLEQPRILVEHWDNDSVKAQQGCQKIHDLILELDGGDPIPGARVKRLSIDGPIPFDDPYAPDMARYQFNASLALRLV